MGGWGEGLFLIALIGYLEKPLSFSPQEAKAGKDSHLSSRDT